MAMLARRRGTAIGVGLACLTAIAAVLVTAPRARAMGDADRLDFVLLALGERPGSETTSAIARLAWEIEKRTSVTSAPKPEVIAAADPMLRRHPLLVLHGRGRLPPLDERSLDALRSHLEAGGTLFIDAADADQPLDGDPFDGDVRQLVRRLFPRGALERVPPGHVLWKTFYLLDGPSGRRLRSTTIEGVSLDGRLAIIYSRNDLLGAQAKDRLGAYVHQPMPGGEPQREQALRMLVNVVMYALCLDYKSDQVHTEELLKRRRGMP